MKRLVRWNLSSRARQLSGGDALVVSIPKSGRTWLRTFLCAYYCEKIGRPFTLEPEKYQGIPRVIYTHDIFEQLTKATRWDKVRGKFLVPRRERARLPVALLARDPRDALVSLHVQFTRRTKETPEELKRKSLSELLRDPANGIKSMVETMNSWLAEWSDRSNFLLLRYEDLRHDPKPGFESLLRLLGEREINRSAFEKAVQFSEFNQMKAREAGGAFDSKILRPGDPVDPESYKVRRGKIGGYADEFSTADQAYAAEALRRLDDRFGYRA
jgi:hypothetical protein